MSFRMLNTLRLARRMARGIEEIAGDFHSPPKPWRAHPFSRNWLDLTPRLMINESFGYIDQMMNKYQKMMESSARHGYKSRPARCFAEKMEMSEQDSPPVYEAGEKFKIDIDLSHFKPENIEVQLVGKRLLIRAEQEETGKEGYRGYREYSQHYLLPENVDVEAMTSNLSKEGTLTLEAPLMEIKAAESWSIPINRAVETPEQEVEVKKAEENVKEPDSK